MLYNYGPVTPTEGYMKPTQQLALKVLQDTYDFHQRVLTDVSSKCVALERWTKAECARMERELQELQTLRDEHQAAKDSLEEVMGQVRKHL